MEVVWRLCRGCGGCGGCVEVVCGDCVWRLGVEIGLTNTLVGGRINFERVFLWEFVFGAILKASQGIGVHPGSLTEDISLCVCD